MSLGQARHNQLVSLEVLAGALFLPSEDLYKHSRIPLARASLDIGLVGLGPMLPTWLTPPGGQTNAFSF